MTLDDRPLLEPNAAGIDIGAREIYVAVPADRDEDPVRVFLTFTADLEEMARWLLSCRITTVAMESTGVYWIPLYDVLERHGIRPCLVNARNMKNVPGRRTDWHECQWIQFLHSVGLLRAAFRPDGNVGAVRSLVRHRTDLVQMAAQHIQHMQKSMTQMNLQIHHVLSEITGVTGLAIVDAILAGERDPAELAKLRDYRVQASEEVVRKSLVGNWEPQHLFTLRQSRQIFQSYQELITACDEEIEKLVIAFEPRVDPAERPLPADRKEKQRKQKVKGVIPGNNPKTGFDMRTEVYKLFGVDVTQIPGLMMTALPLFSETGRDMSRWKTADHFASWAGLCPDNDITGGKVAWSGMRSRRNRTGQLFCMAAFGLHHELSPMGDYLRRKKANMGPAGAQIATAHKLAVIFYTMVKNQVEYDASIWAKRDAERDKRIEARLRRQAGQKGYKLVRIEENTAA
jgi:transposase